MHFQQFVPIGDRFVFADYKKAEGGHPTLVLLNGLSQDLGHWDPFIAALSTPEFGILRLDFRGQGRTLDREIRERGAFDRDVSVAEQSDDLKALVDHFGIDSPLVIVGHSYGGGIALHFSAMWPDRVRNLILIAPYLLRLDYAHPLLRAWSRNFESLHRLGIPTGAGAHHHFVGGLYGNLISHFMDYRFRGMLPDPVQRRASIHLTLGIMAYDGFKTLRHLPRGSLHLVSADLDILVPANIYLEMWDRLPSGVAESWLAVEDGEHLMVDQNPLFCARWTELIARGDARISGGRRFAGQAYSFEVAETKTGCRFSLHRSLGARHPDLGNPVPGL